MLAKELSFCCLFFVEICAQIHMSNLLFGFQIEMGVAFERLVIVARATLSEKNVVSRWLLVIIVGHTASPCKPTGKVSDLSENASHSGLVAATRGEACPVLRDIRRPNKPTIGWRH